jgi:hypothetical protein
VTPIISRYSITWVDSQEADLPVDRGASVVVAPTPRWLHRYSAWL